MYVSSTHTAFALLVGGKKFNPPEFVYEPPPQEHDTIKSLRNKIDLAKGMGKPPAVIA